LTREQTWLNRVAVATGVRDLARRVAPSGPSVRLLGGAWWSGVGSATSQGLSMLAFILVARRLTTEQFGALGILLSTIGTFGMLGTAGMGLTAIRYVAELRTNDPQRASRVLVVALATAYSAAVLLGAVVWLRAPWVAATLFNAPSLGPDLRLAVVAMVLAAITAVQSGALVGFEAFRTLAGINSTRGVLTVVALPLAALLGGVRAVVGALGAVAVVTFLLGEWALMRQRRAHRMVLVPEGSLGEWRLLIEFTLPAYVTGVIYPAALWGLGALLVQVPTGYHEMGLFSAASQWRNAIAFLPQIIGQPVLTVLANVAGSGDRAEFNRVYRFAVRLTTVAALGPGIVVSLLAGLIMGAYGAGFAGGRLVLVLLAAAVVLNAPCGVMGSALASHGRMWWVAALNVLWVAVVFTAFLALPQVSGAVRAGLAIMIAHVVHLGTSAFVVRRTGVVNPAPRENGRDAGPTSAAATS
jgi:O-antigen/teichoic acid export membrane protein